MITVNIYPAGGLFTRRKYRFSIRGANHEIIATSGRQSYFNKGDLLDTLRLIFGSIEHTPVIARFIDTGDETVLR